MRDAGVEHGVDVERLKTAYRERAELQETNALAVQMRLLPIGVDAVARERDALRRFLNLSDGEPFELGASIGFAGIRLPYWLYSISLLLFDEGIYSINNTMCCVFILVTVDYC